MPYYAYKARDAAGRPASGTLEAPGQAEAARQLREQGYFVTYLEVDKDLASIWRRVVATRAARRVARIRLKDLAVFCRQFSTLLGAGLPILTALRTLAGQAGSRRLRRVLSEVVEDLQAGETLTAAFRRRGESFPSVLLSLVAAGEVGGFLEEVFERLSAYFEREETLNQKVRSAVAYPAAVLVVAVGVLTFAVIVVIPQYARLFTEVGASLPWPTRAVVRLSEFVARFWSWMLLALALIILTARHLAVTPRGRAWIDRLVLRLPVVGPLLARRALARLCRTLATLLRSGVPILSALRVVETTAQNAVIAGAIRKAEGAVREGQGLTRPLRESGIFPPLVTEMMAVGEETGSVEEMLYKVADFYEKEIDHTVQRLTSLLEPAIILALGVVVGFIVVSVVLPMFDVFGRLQP